MVLSWMPLLHILTLTMARHVGPIQYNYFQTQGFFTTPKKNLLTDNQFSYHEITDLKKAKKPNPSISHCLKSFLNWVRQSQTQSIQLYWFLGLKKSQQPKIAII